MTAMSRYEGKEQSLRAIFGATSVSVHDDRIVVDGRPFAVVDDVIITLPPDRLPPSLGGTRAEHAGDFAEDVQYSFGAEWSDHGDVLPEHAQEFRDYFDLVDVDALARHRVADLGCGSGRWATFVAPHCAELVAVDFSEAIFVTRRNLAAHDNVIFVMGDVTALPFAPDAFDFAYCLGVLHHLPIDALDACRRLAPFSPELLVYLYYALDNRPAYYRALLSIVTPVRRALSNLRDRRIRNVLALVIAATVYLPLSWLGTLLGEHGRNRVPLADTYAGKSLRRLQQDAYDRFFTGIEQRFTRTQILGLRDTYAEVAVSDGLPYWHFLCRR